jgi:hypothetical protein
MCFGCGPGSCGSKTLGHINLHKNRIVAKIQVPGKKVDDRWSLHVWIRHQSLSLPTVPFDLVALQGDGLVVRVLCLAAACGGPANR